MAKTPALFSDHFHRLNCSTTKV